MLGRIGAESAGLEQVGDRVTDRYPDDELGDAPLQAFIEEVIQQGRAILKPVQVGTQTQVEDLPDIRTKGSVLRLDETLDHAMAALLHDVDMVRRRRDRQDRGEGVV